MCDRIKLKISIDKSKILMVKEDQKAKMVKVNGEGLREEVVKLKYLGVMIRTDGGLGEEVTHRLHEGKEISLQFTLYKKIFIKYFVLFLNRIDLFFTILPLTRYFF